MKKVIYICILSIIFAIGLSGCNSKDAEKIVLFGSEQQKKELHTPLVEDKFDFSELGYIKKMEISPKYYGRYNLSVNLFDANKSVREELSKYEKVFLNCVKFRLYIENEIFEETFSNDPSSFFGITYDGVALFNFDIKEEYLNKKIFVEIEVIKTNEWLKKEVKEKNITIQAGQNM